MGIFGKKAKASRTNSSKNTQAITRKKAKYPLFKGYNPHAIRGIMHKKTPREARLNTAWEILDPPGDGEGPGYKGKIRARVAELEDIQSPTNTDRIELTYLKNLQTQNLNEDGRYYLDDESFKWNTYKGKAKNGWNAAAEAEWAAAHAPPPAPAAAAPAPATAPAKKSWLPSFGSKAKANPKVNNPTAAPSDPTPPVINQSTVSNAGDPTNINSTIKRMKCIVCNSQFIIYDGLGKKGEAPKCSKCNSSSSINMNLIPGANNDKTAASNNNINKGTAYFPPPRKGAKTKAAETSTNPFNNNSTITPDTSGPNPFNQFNNTTIAETKGGKRSTRKQRKNKKRASRRR